MLKVRVLCRGLVDLVGCKVLNTLQAIEPVVIIGNVVIGPLIIALFQHGIALGLAVVSVDLRVYPRV